MEALLSFVQWLLELLHGRWNDREKIVVVVEDKPVYNERFDPMIRIVNESHRPVTVVEFGFEPLSPEGGKREARFGVRHLSERLEERAMIRHRAVSVAVDEESATPELFRLFVETAPCHVKYFETFKKSDLRSTSKFGPDAFPVFTF